MTITVSSLVAGPFTATGASQELPFTFKVFSTDEIEVYYADSGAVIDPAAYTVSRNTSAAGDALEGGTVTLDAGAALAGEDVSVRAVPDFLQGQTYSSAGTRLENLNEALDRGALRDNFLNEKIDSAVTEAGSLLGLLGKVDKTALAAVTGAALIGFLLPYTGAKAQTAQAALEVSLSSAAFGVVGDGTSVTLAALYGTLAEAQVDYPFATTLDAEADWARAQALINAAQISGKVANLGGFLDNVRIDRALSITAPVTIEGAGTRLTGIISTAGNAIEIAEGVDNVTIRNLGILSAVRFTTTPHSNIGVKILGTNAGNCENIRIERCFFDGWSEAIQGNYVREGVFDFDTVYCHTGIWLKGQSTNWTIMGSSKIAGVDSILGTPAATSTGIRVGDNTGPQPEGGCVQGGTLVFGFARGFRNQGAINNTLEPGVILDGISEFGMLIQSSDTALAANNNYFSPYIGMSGGAGSIGIYITNGTTTAGLLDQSRGELVDSPEIAIYATKSVDYGVLVEGAGNRNVTVRSLKEIKGTVNVRGVSFTGGSGGMAFGNTWGSGGFSTAVAVGFSNNAGTVAAGSALCVDAVSIVDALNEYRVAGTRVLGPRKTGWDLPTGTFTRTTFDPATVTLPQLAERVAALVNDLHASGASSTHALVGT